MTTPIRSIRQMILRPFIFLGAILFYMDPISGVLAANSDIAVNSKQPGQIVAHRGASAERPECTLASVKRAIEVGATATEVDVRRSKDGQLFILHDRTLERTTNGKGPANLLTLAELKELDAGSHFDEKYQDERIPSLIEVAELCRGKIDLFLDLKEQGGDFDEDVASVILKHGDPAKTLLGPRSVEQAKRFRKLLPEAKQIAIMPGVDEIEAFAEAGADYILIWSKWLKKSDEPVRRVRAAGAKLHLNQASGELEDTLRQLAYEPDSLAGDDPAKLLKTLKRIADENL